MSSDIYPHTLINITTVNSEKNNHDGITDQQSTSYINTCVAHRKNYWNYINGKPTHIKRFLSDVMIQACIQGHVTLGLSPFIDNEYVKYGGIDFDVHGFTDGERKRLLEKYNGDTAKVAALEAEDIAKKTAIVEEHFQKVAALLTKEGYLFFANSSGSAGRHARVYSNKPILGSVMQYFLIDLYERATGETPAEVFPKQPRLDAETPYGNQMKAVLAIHPKHKKIAGIIDIATGRVMDRFESLDFLVEFEKKIAQAKPITFEVTEEVEKKHRKVGIYDKTKLKDGKVDGFIPKYCPFIEQVAAKRLLPSGRATRHDYIDGNVARYAQNKPQVLADYCRIQGRSSDAFNNSEFWRFSCNNLKAYLRMNDETDEAIQEGKRVCDGCTNKAQERVFKQHTGSYDDFARLAEIAHNKWLYKKAKGLISDNTPMPKIAQRYENLKKVRDLIYG